MGSPPRRRSVLRAVACGIVLVAAGAGVGTAAATDRATAVPLGSREFAVRHRDPNDLVKVLRALGSGADGARLSEDRRRRVISVRDFPENIAAIERTLERLDVPRPPQPRIELRMELLLGARDGEPAVPSDLDGVVRDLRGRLGYRSWSRVASVTEQLETGGDADGKGTCAAGPAARGPDARYRYELREVRVLPRDARGRQTIEVGRLRFWARGPLGEAELGSTLRLREGERVVVGPAGMKDSALVLVLSARPVR